MTLPAFQASPEPTPHPPGAAPIRCAIVGASGYSGAELVRILLQHPQAAIVGLFASARRGGEDGPQPLSAVFPRFAKRTTLALQPTSVEAIAASRADVVFLATPNEASHDLAPALMALSPAPVVIDLSGAFRLRTTDAYPRHYGFEHQHPELLQEAVYGMAELLRTPLRSARLVANPGCYPTASILALRPLIAAGAIRTAPRPIIDAISGVSGAGRAADLRSHFCEVSVQPYNVLRHRHNPEIDLHAGTRTVFTPHLGPYDRGILATIHAQLADGFGREQIAAIYEDEYRDEPFVRLLPEGQWPSVAAVRGTNCCDIGFAVDTVDDHLVVASTIDNLVKGAAGQAVQCMNIRFAVEETAGLLGEAA